MADLSSAKIFGIADKMRNYLNTDGEGVLYFYASSLVGHSLLRACNAIKYLLETCEALPMHASQNRPENFIVFKALIPKIPLYET